MNPLYLLILRTYNLTLGRFAWGDQFLRRTLEYFIIWRKPPGERYTASAGFFDVRDLDPADPPD